MRLPAGWSTGVLVMRALLFVLPVAALMTALPQVPHPAVIVLVTICALQWAHSPDHLAGAVGLVLVVGWWTAHGVVDWRIVVVGGLLVAAHVIATVLSHGPGTLRIDRELALLWAGRGGLSLVPLAVAYLAVRGLDPVLAPASLWMLAALVLIGLSLAASRLTRTESA